MSNNIFKFRPIIYFIVILCVLIYSALYGPHSLVYKYLSIIPLMFCFLEVINLKVERDFKSVHSISYYLFKIVCFIKYFLMPLSLIYLGEDSLYKVFGPTPTDANLIKAISLLIYELIVVYLTRYIFILRNKNRRLVISNLSSSYSRNNKIVFFVVLTGIVLSIIPNVYIIPRVLFLTSDVVKDDLAMDNVSNLQVFVIVWKYLFFIVCASSIFKINQSKYSFFKVFLYLILVIICLYLLSGTSRWGIVFFTLIALTLIRQKYGSKTNWLILLIATFSFVIFTSISIYKFSWAVQGDSPLIVELFNVYISLLQSYFSGPSLIAQSYDMIESLFYESNITFITCINDFLGTMPFVSKLVDLSDRTNVYFNQYLFGMHTTNISQIIPMSSVGMLYFSSFFAPLFVCIFLYIGFHFEQKALQSNMLYKRFIFLYISFWCVLSIALNTQIVFGNILLTPILLLFIFKLIKCK